MATLAGTRDIVDTLNSLIALDYDAIEAYEAAIERLQNSPDRDQLRFFMGDHQRHTRDVGVLVENLGGKPADRADIKQVLTKGKVVLAGLIGDTSILKAMKSNEDDTNAAYEKALKQPGLTEAVREVLSRNLSDERRHRAWIEHRLQNVSTSPSANVPLV